MNYTIDDNSRLTQVIAPTGTYGFTFDNMGRLTNTTTTYAFLTGRNFITSYGYDAASNRTGFVDPEGGSSSYVYGSWIFIVAVSLLMVVSIRAQVKPNYTTDNSDWWSHTRKVEFDKSSLVQSREPAAANFAILGVELDDDVFGKAAAKFGKSEIIERGDAATGRSQACYASVEDSPRIHLIFEKGEVNESLYLFQDGPDWKGSDRCARSSLVAKDLSTATGLRLGQTVSEIKQALGNPSTEIADRLVYIFGVVKRSSEKDFENLKPRYPQLSDEQLRREYEFYTLGVYIEARFWSGKLRYLVVSKTEAY